jgi:hypothetical protein
LQRTDNARLLHRLEHACGAVIADLQAPLHIGDRRFALARDDLDRLVVERILLGVGGNGLIGLVLVVAEAWNRSRGTLEHLLDIVRRGSLFETLDDAMHFLIGHECAVNARRHRGAWRQEQHVPVPEQRLRAHLIEYRA